MNRREFMANSVALAATTAISPLPQDAFTVEGNVDVVFNGVYDIETHFLDGIRHVLWNPHLTSNPAEEYKDVR